MLADTQAIDMRLPIVDAVMLGGGGKFDLFRNVIDDAVVGITVIVSAGGG
jgi:hypothetical protein